MPDQRWIRIVQYLYEEKAGVPVSRLAEQLKVSERTIRNIMDQNRGENGKYGFRIDKNIGRGNVYQLIVENSNEFEVFLTQMSRKEDETSFRVKYMICRLLREEAWLRIETLAEEMYLSRATLDRLMPDIKMIAAQYGLQLTARPRYGIRLEGTEKARRLCYAHCARSRILDFPETFTMKVQDILMTALREYHLTLSDNNFYNLVQHCVIAVRRIASGNGLTEEETTWEEDSQNEKLAARKIVSELEKAFFIEIPAAEETYIAMHLLGKKVLRQKDVITEETLSCVDEILLEIRDRKGIDLGSDTELRASLALHIQSLISRLRYGLKQENPVLQDIKKEMGEGYELALCAVEVMDRCFGLRMDDDEAGYLALHFALSLEKRQKALPERRILIVCASGRGTARLIRYRLAEQYHFREEDMVLLSAMQLDQENFADTLCILSTIPLRKDYPVPVLRIDLNLSRQSMEKIDRFLLSETKSQQPGRRESWRKYLDERLLFWNVDIKSKEEVLDFGCEQIGRFLTVPEDFRAQVYKREDLSTTEVGNQTALPHPYEYGGSESVFCFITLKNPVKWKFQPVRLVIFMALPQKPEREAEKMSEAVTRLVCDRESCHKLMNSLNIDVVEEVLYGRDRK